MKRTSRGSRLVLLLNLLSIGLSSHVRAENGCRHDPERVGECLHLRGSAGITLPIGSSFWPDNENPHRIIVIDGDWPQAMDSFFDRYPGGQILGEFEICPLMDAPPEYPVKYRTCIVSVSHPILRMPGEDDRVCKDDSCKME